jgi:nitrogen regulatory protein PII
MKQVIAIVKPFLAEKVLEGLRLAPIEACSVREVKGYGRQKSYLDQYGESEYSMAFLPKVEISLWVEDTRVDEVVRQIVEVARTGRMGDGKIFVLSTQSGGTVIDIESTKAGAGLASTETASPAKSAAGSKSFSRRKSAKS